MFTIELPSREAQTLIDAWHKDQIIVDGEFDITVLDGFTIIKSKYPANTFTNKELKTIKEYLRNIFDNSLTPYVFISGNSSRYQYYINGSISSSANSTVVPFIWKEQLQQYAYRLMLKATE